MKYVGYLRTGKQYGRQLKHYLMDGGYFHSGRPDSRYPRYVVSDKCQLDVVIEMTVKPEMEFHNQRDSTHIRVLFVEDAK